MPSATVPGQYVTIFFLLYMFIDVFRFVQYIINYKLNYAMTTFSDYCAASIAHKRRTLIVNKASRRLNIGVVTVRYFTDNDQLQYY
jgi:hypothetical protein